jgi:uncharacterized membrane protein (DUF485 family)
MSWEASAGIVAIGAVWMVNLTAFGLDKEKHPHIKMFLMMMSFFLLVPVINFARQLAVDNSASAEATNMLAILLGAFMFTVLVTAIYFFYSWLVELFRAMQKARQEERGVKDEY